MMKVSIKRSFLPSICLVLLILNGCTVESDSQSEVTREAVDTLKADLDLFVMTVFLRPDSERGFDPRIELLSGIFYVTPMLMSPPMVNADGEPIEAAVMISSEEAGRLVDVLAKRGYFERAERGHIHQAPIQLPDRPLVRINVSGPSGIRYQGILNWDEETQQALMEMEKVLEGEAAELMATLARQLRNSNGDAASIVN